MFTISCPKRYGARVPPQRWRHPSQQSLLDVGTQARAPERIPEGERKKKKNKEIGKEGGERKKRKERGEGGERGRRKKKRVRVDEINARCANKNKAVCRLLIHFFFFYYLFFFCIYQLLFVHTLGHLLANNVSYPLILKSQTSRNAGVLHGRHT